MRPFLEGMARTARMTGRAAGSLTAAGHQAGREAGSAVGHSLGVLYAGASLMLGVALLTLWLLLGSSIRKLSSRAMLSLTGRFRPRPDPWLEAALRAAFAEFDSELAMVLRDRGAGPHHPDH